MSAELNKDDKHWLLNGKLGGGLLTPEEEALVGAGFDAETDLDVVTITKNMELTKSIKKKCLVNVLTAPLTLPLTLFISGFSDAKVLKERIGLSYRFLRDELSLTELNKLLLLATKGSIIV